MYGETLARFAVRFAPFAVRFSRTAKHCSAVVSPVHVNVAPENEQSKYRRGHCTIFQLVDQFIYSCYAFFLRSSDALTIFTKKRISTFAKIHIF
jgi:hypothetical protein